MKKSKMREIERRNFIGNVILFALFVTFNVILALFAWPRIIEKRKRRRRKC